MFGRIALALTTLWQGKSGSGTPPLTDGGMAGQGMAAYSPDALDFDAELDGCFMNGRLGSTPAAAGGYQVSCVDIG